MARYEGVTKKFHKFFDQDFLRQIVERKADMAALEKAKVDFIR